MAKVRVSMIKVDVPYGTRIGDLIDVLESLNLKYAGLCLSTPEELEFSLSDDNNEE